MKTKFTLPIIVACAFVLQLFFVSCNSSLEITKRRYNKGFYVDLSSNNPSHDVKTATPVNREMATINTVTAPATIVAAQNADLPSQQIAENRDASASTGTELTPQVVSKPVAAKSHVSAVVNTSNELKAKSLTAMNETKAVKHSVKEAKKANRTHSGGKSQLIALILCIVVGGLGIHRFYLGYIWQGVVQLLTAGGCGIWWLIDLIRIITGDLEPKDGSYDTTL